MRMKQARRRFANRVMVAPSFKDAEGVEHPRRNERRQRGTSFRAWVREHFNSLGAIRSSKLARIIQAGH